MRQLFVPPLKNEDDLVVPKGWVEMAKDHWRMFLPKMYASLQKEGELDEEARGAAYFAADSMREMMEKGVSESEAGRAFREAWATLPVHP